MKRTVMAVIVCFNGGEKIVNAVQSLQGQVDYIHIVDNGSEHETIRVLDRLIENFSVTVTWLSNNKGIGYALNIGIHHARTLRCEWLLTMDQDSVPSHDMLTSYFNVLDKNDFSCLTPMFSASQEAIVAQCVRQVDYAITSGNLVRMDIFERVYGYDESLFIDGVDFDFSLKVRLAGYKIYAIASAQMAHELGDKDCRVPVLGKFHTYHSPLRRYYIFRNYLYIMSRYCWKFPQFSLKFTLVHVISLINIVVLGEDRVKSLRYIGRGIRDFYADKYGACQNDS